MTITLPITLAIVRALLIEVASQVFAVPLSSVLEAIAFDPSRVNRVDGRDMMTLRGTTLPLCDLDQLLAIEREQPPPARRYVVVAAIGSRRLGIVVDFLFGQQDIVIKALGRSLAKVKGFAGATDLGDQHVGLVLDVGSLIEESFHSGDVAEPRGLLS
jgi:two-component system chemotaxis sensor kinase CheA